MLKIVKNCQKLLKISEINKMLKLSKLSKIFQNINKSKVVEVDVLKTTKYNTAKLFQMLSEFTDLRLRRLI